MSSVVLIGTTGLVGEQILLLLLESNSISNVTSVSRSKLDYTHPKLTKLYTEDLSSSFFEENKVCGDIFISALGTTIKKAGSKENFERIDFELNKDFALYASKTGANTFALVSAINADPNSPIFYSRVKGRLENEVKKLPFKRLILLKPSLLIGERQESRPLESLSQSAVKILSKIMPKSVREKLASSPEIVAAELIRVLETKGEGIYELQNFYQE